MNDRFLKTWPTSLVRMPFVREMTQMAGGGKRGEALSLRWKLENMKGFFLIYNTAKIPTTCGILLKTLGFVYRDTAIL